MKRAFLTGEVAHWKDFSWGLSQLISKGNVKSSDDLAHRCLTTLVDNKEMLGDKSTEVVLMMAESEMLRKNDKRAEELLIDLAVDNKDLDSDFLPYLESVAGASCAMLLGAP